MADVLDVYLHAQQVGRLTLDGRRRFVFEYSPDYLRTDNPLPLSLALPLRPEPYPDDQARPFFVNLLPESELRRIIARRLGLSEQNDFALLEAVGGECAGAVSLLPEGVEPQERGSYRELDEDALNKLIAELPNRPLLAGEEGIRLSLAGAQNKLPVFFDGKQISLPLGSAPSSHILKPPIATYPETVQNEAFCMRLARRAGLSVPEVQVLRKDTPLYLIARYDRQRDSFGRLVRLHQEDFCQALGIAPDMKYEKEGGPSLADCFGLIRRRSIQPVADLRALLQWLIFNLLIGNADAHSKNISLLLSAPGPRLAPFYDLMCTAVYPQLTDRLAMRIGGEDRPDWLTGRRWEAFAEEVGIGYKLVRQVLSQIGGALLERAREEAALVAQDWGKSDVVNRIVNVIERRSRKLRAALDTQEA